MSRKETGVTQRHTRSCPRTAGGSYAPHKCTGLWSYVVDVGRDSNGRRIQEKKGGFLTKQEAREARAARVTTLSSRTADAHRLTVEDFLEQWLEGKRKLRPSTLASYREYIDGVFKPHIGSLRLVELERHPEHLDRMFTALAQPRENGRRLAVGTIHRMYGALRAALNVAVRRRLITFNPALTIELEELPRPRIVVWTAEQVGEFLDFVKDDRLYPLLRLVLMTGLRRGEAVGLRWSDVDLDEKVLTVRQQVVDVGGELHIGAPKTKSGERVVPFDEETAAVLRAQQRAQAAERLAWGEAWVESGLVFTNEDGSILRPEALSRRFKGLAEKSGLPVIRFHDLRHTSASLALSADVAMKVVSVRLGHSSTGFTADRYTHVVPAVAKDAADRIADVVSLAAKRKGHTEAGRGHNDVTAM
jgi:integrase